VAKGNNGNLLQHFVECEMASELTQQMLTKRLHVIFTHGMAPYEKCEPLPPGEPGELRDLLKALGGIDEGAIEALGFPVLLAYKRLGATEDHFPNSAEVVASVLADRAAIAGEICENDATRAAGLTDAWGMSSMNIRQGSWRDAVKYLVAPAKTDTPWLFAMDPYAFKQREFLEIEDDGYLDQHDLLTLKPIVTGHFNTGARGIASVLSYHMLPAEALAFESALIDFCHMLDEGVHFEVSNCFIPTPSREGAEHVAALIAEDSDLIERVRTRWKGCLEAVRVLTG
jgi:hypothetical protein